MLAVATGLVGGLLLVCGVPFVSPRSYKIGGGFLLFSGKLPSCRNGIQPIPHRNVSVLCFVLTGEREAAGDEVLLREKGALMGTAPTQSK